MARRQHLTDAQIAELFDPPADQRELVRRYMLSDADLAAIRRGHGDPNQLGHALMLCYLRYPGRQLRASEQPPARMLEFVADQIGVLPTALGSYLGADRNRLYHVAELQERLRTRSFNAKAAMELRAWLLPRAVEDERFLHLARLVLEECRQRRIVLPSPAVLERLCVEVRHKARTESHRRLTNGLSAEQLKGLDALTGRREPGGQNWLTWLRQMPEAAKPAAPGPTAALIIGPSSRR